MGIMRWLCSLKLFNAVICRFSGENATSIVHQLLRAEPKAYRELVSEALNDVRRIIGKKDLLGRTRILRRNPARSYSGSCCADGRALWVCNACFF